MPSDLPPPLPPETRTVGQLVAESVRLYGRKFWRSLLLGVPPAAVGVVIALLPEDARVATALLVVPPVFSACFAGGVAIASGVRPGPGPLLTAVGAGVVVLLPIPLLLSLFQIIGLAWLPAIAWLALVGLVVPVAILERTPFLETFRRAFALGRADYIHALGSLAALAIVSLLTSWVLFFVLRGQGDATLSAAAFLSVLVISPLLFLGSSLLYFDQAARSDRMDEDAGVPRGQPDAPGPVRHQTARRPYRGAHRPRDDRR